MEELKRKHLSEEHKRKISEHHKSLGENHWCKKPEIREKIRRGHLGKRLSEEHRQKIVLRMKKMWSNPEFKKKMSEKIKLAWLKRNRKMSLEQRKKISEAHKGKKLSKETRRKISERIKEYLKKHPEVIEKFKERRGEKSPSWKGGKTQFGRAFRSSPRYKELRKLCLERDNFTCQKCGQNGGILEIHHIFNTADYPELRYSLTNCITLCRNCHKEFHRRYGIYNNNNGQLEEFFSSS
jgi:hypothetical protein